MNKGRNMFGLLERTTLASVLQTVKVQPSRKRPPNSITMAHSGRYVLPRLARSTGMAGSRGPLWAALLVCSATLLWHHRCGCRPRYPDHRGCGPSRPNPCWHWADPYGHRAYWDYCY